MRPSDRPTVRPSDRPTVRPSDRPRNDPPTDNLTTLGEAECDAALRRFEALRPHLQHRVALTEAARAANVPVRSVQRWVARYPCRPFSHLPAAATRQHRTPVNTPHFCTILDASTPHPCLAPHRRRTRAALYFYLCGLPRPDHPQPPSHRAAPLRVELPTSRLPR